MTAYELYCQTTDVPLDKLMQRLMLELGENDAWYKFLVKKGANGTEASEREITKARATKKPERILIPAILVDMPTYMALEWLEDLRSIPDVAEQAQAIMLYLAQEESAAQTSAAKSARINGEIRAFIVDNELASNLSVGHIQMLLDNLKRFGVGSLADLKEMTEQQFVRCGFEGFYVTKALKAVQKMK